MKHSLIALAIGLLTCAAAPAASVDLPEYGFTMNLLDGQPAAEGGTALMTFLPASDGFAPNINVQIQTYAGTIQEYVTFSKSQFAQMNWTVSTEKIAGNEWIVEYAGSLQGADLRFYARAVSKGEKVYLITGTAKDTQWDTVGDTLRKTVDSFALKP